MGHKTHKSKSKIVGFTAMLLCGVSIAAPAYADTTTWTGAISDDPNDPGNWDTQPDQNNSQTIVNTANGRDPVSRLDSNNTNVNISGSPLNIGDGSTGTGVGSWTVDYTALNPDGQGYASVGNTNIGINGGKGRLFLNFGAPSSTATLMTSSVASLNGIYVGNGTGSTGTVDAISTGVGHRNANTMLSGYVGLMGGNGTVNLDGVTGMGANLFLGTAATDINAITDGSLIDPAIAATTSGTINVLNGGKYGGKGYTKVGNKGGTGTINVSGSDANGSLPSTLKSVGTPLSVGKGV